jgi:Sulfatase
VTVAPNNTEGPSAGGTSGRGGRRVAELPGDEAAPHARGVRAELLAGLEIAALTGLAFTRPILDSFGRTPQAFLARDADRGDVVLFALVVALVPALAVAAVAAATRVAGWRVRRWAHLAVVGGLGAMVAWRFGSDLSDLGRRTLLALGVAGGATLALLRYRLPQTATFLRILGAASALFLFQFLVLSPSSSLALTGGDAGVDQELTDAVVAGTGGDPPPVVMLVLDGLGTTQLLDGAGRIDAGLYPNLAALAGDATWYRNNSTVSAWTYEAVPSLLTGTLPPSSSELPDTATYPDNLLALFAGTHEMHVVEQITRLCPAEACPTNDGGALSSLLGDAASWWRGAAEQDDERGAAEILPGALDPDRGAEFADWVAEQDFSAGDRPGMWFYHLVMPHEPWDLLDDATPYAQLGESPFGLFLSNWWGDVGYDVARQRQVLQTQAIDGMVGDMLDRLRDAGTYDDTLVVVTADHGQAFAGGRAPLRGVAEAQYEQIAWTPLLVKAPGQAEAAVDDTNLWSIDLVPTLADVLGIDLPWTPDGVPAAEVDREPGDKQVRDHEYHEIDPPEGSDMVPLDGREGFDRVLAADPVAGEGDHAVWQRTAHGRLVGQRVDDLAVGAEADGSLEVEQLDRLIGPGDGPRLLEFLGHTSLPLGEVVAVAVNGVVVATAPVETLSPNLGPGVHALLLPEPFAADNEVTAYLVDGEPGSESLRPLAVTPR